MNNSNKMAAIFSNISTNPVLSPLVDERPIATLPFDCKYRLIDFPMSMLSHANVNKIFMTFNQGETQSVFDHLGSGSEWGLDGFNNRYFVYIHQDFQRKKEAGIENYYQQQIDFLRKSKAPYTVLLGSKFICNVDLNAVLKIHKSKGKPLTAVYKNMCPSNAEPLDTFFRFDEEGNVTTNFAEELVDPKEKEALSLNIFVADTEWLISFVEKMQAECEFASISRLIRKYMSKTNMSVNTYEYTGYMSNIRSIKSYYDANMAMLEANNFTSLFYGSQPIYTKIKNEVPTYFSKGSQVKNSQFGSGCVIKGHVENSQISRGANVGAGAEVNHSLVFTSSEVKENAHIKYAIIDKHVIVEEGVKIEGTAENPVVIAKHTIVTDDIIQK